MEDRAHSQNLRDVSLPTRDERFRLLKQLDDEVRHLTRTYLRRKTETREAATGEIPDPQGYDSFRDYQLSRIVDKVFVPGCYAEYLDLVDALRRKRDQLRTYAARRTGNSDNRYQSRTEWDIWSNGDPLPSICGFKRESARRSFRSGENYEATLWLVAINWMMDYGQPDRCRAAAIKKSVDKAYFDIFGTKAPPAPRGWWYPANDLRLTPGGLQMLGLTWAPKSDLHSQRKISIVPFHILADWTSEFSCWKDDSEWWP